MKGKELLEGEGKREVSRRMGGLSRKAKWLKGKNKKNGYEERRKIIMGTGEG